MSKYEHRAVEALHAVLASSQLTDQLRATETREGLPAGTLTDPVDVVQASTPFDNRSPLIQVFEEDTDIPQAGQRQDLLAVDCSILLSYTGDADIEASELFMRLYMTALRDTIRLNPLLAMPLVSSAPAGDILGALIQGSSTAEFGDDSTTRLHRALFVQVRVHTP